MHPKSEEADFVEDKLFVYNVPKDIVSGDFYWYTHKGDRTIICGADCTGHGVPGAFMSMIGITFLNEIVTKRGILSPDLILNRLRTMVIDALSVDGTSSKDGMDLALLAVDWDNLNLEYAGAHNPLYLIRSKAGTPLEGASSQLTDDKFDHVLYEVKADKMPIGCARQ